MLVNIESSTFEKDNKQFMKNKTYQRSKEKCGWGVWRVSYARPEFADSGNHRLNGLDKITYKRRARNKLFSRKQMYLSV